jgi:hypothetical protein
VIIACGLGIAAYTIVSIGGGKTGVDSSAVKGGARPGVANSLSESEYRVQATGICAEYRDESTRITEAEGNRAQLGSHLQLETRIREELKALRPPRRLAAGHRKVLALWGRRLTIMGYLYDSLRRELSDPAYRRKLARYLSQVDDLAGQIDQVFLGLDLTPECSLLS